MADKPGKGTLIATDSTSSPCLNRRYLLKALGALPFAPLSLANDVDSTPHIHERADAKDHRGHAFPAPFNNSELAALTLMADWIIPADERSGSASEAGVIGFLSDWLALTGDDSLATIKGGLWWLDNTCRDEYHRVFALCSRPQQQLVVDRIAWPGRTAPEDLAGEIFFSRLRDLVVGAFFSTEMGIRDLPFLGNEVMREWTGCPDTVVDRLR